MYINLSVKLAPTRNFKVSPHGSVNHKVLMVWHWRRINLQRQKIIEINGFIKTVVRS